MTTKRGPIAVALLASLVAALLRRSSIKRGRHGPAGLCTDLLPPSAPAAAVTADDDGAADAAHPDDASGTDNHHPCRTFSESYHEARSKFRTAATAVPGVTVTTLDVVPGEDYTMDIAVVPGDDDGEGGEGGGGGGLVVHTSGIHGIEGFAGSAVQVAALRRMASEASISSSSTPTRRDRPTIIFVHAVNPFGMAHYRRCNERNVDLNRNALRDDEWPDVLRRDPNFVGYDDFDRTMFNPPHGPTFVHAHVISWWEMMLAILKNGFVNMKRSMLTGQYHNPRGIFYGGKELEPSHRLLRGFLVEGGWTAVDDSSSSASASTVTWVDVHTGLGPSGVDTLLIDGDCTDVQHWFPGAPRPVQCINRDDDKGGKEKEDAEASDDVVAGYDLTRGVMNTFYDGLFRRKGSSSSSPREDDPSLRPLVVTQEFGTVPALSVARALVLENMSFNYAPHEQPFWAKYSRDAFYVRTDEWRRSVLERGLIVLDQAVRRSSAASASTESGADK